MSIVSTGTQWIAARRTTLRRLGLGASLLIVVAGLWLVFRGGRNSQATVIEDWNSTIRTLGIEPIFPPEEDFYVGDLLAVVINDTHEKPSSTRSRPLLNRAIKVAHVDLSKQLDNYYSQLPIFSPTQDRPSAAGRYWPQKEDPNGSFAMAGKRNVLPIAAFPGFVVENQTSGSGALSYLLGNRLAATLQQSDDVQLQIPFVESYGVPSYEAKKALDGYCAAHESDCSEDSLREQLEYVSGEPKGYMSEKDVDAVGIFHYKVEIELALVNRVYLTRSIEQKAGHGGKGSIGAEASDLSASAPGAAVAPADAGSSRADASVSADRSWNDASNLDQTFERPIAFGYRAVKRRFENNLSPNFGGDPAIQLAPGQVQTEPTKP